MFRASLRSASDPVLREHVCLSCLAAGRPQARLFFSTPPSRVGSGKSANDALKTLTETLKSHSEKDPTKKKKSKKNQQPITAETQDAGAKQPPGDSTLPELQRILKRLVNQLEKHAEEKREEIKTTALEDQGFPQPPRNVVSGLVSRERGKVSAKSKKSRFKEVQTETPKVPQLSYGLQRVLFNPGVYHLRDPRSRVFNFDPYLGSVMPVTEFDFAALKDYVTSSKDDTLRNIAIKNGKKYVGSTSSMTSVLSHFHYLLSAWRPVETGLVSRDFPDNSREFTRILRAPAAVFLRYQDGIYAIDADKEHDTINILMNLGKSMEKLLTVPKSEFERYRRSHENKITPEEEQSTPEAYHYSTVGDFMMRSQLDAHDPRLPGTGMFDLKTRAAVSIRMDVRNFDKGLGYQIKSRFGQYESYDREYFDMIRSAFLKYALQVRMGRMDGIFVAFHNIQQIFGFQYISLPEMDKALHGQWDTTLGDAEFRLSLQLWNKILNKAVAKYPKRSLRFHFEARETETPCMYIFYEPVTDEEIHAIQTKNKAEIDALQNRILNLDPKEVEQDISTTADESNGVEPEDEEALSAVQSEEASVESDTVPEGEKREVSAMVLTLANHVNGKRVVRPSNLTPEDSWIVEYELSELSDTKAAAGYANCKKRRKIYLGARGEDVPGRESGYIKKLRLLSKEGRAFRSEQKRLDKKRGKVVFDEVKV